MFLELNSQEQQVLMQLVEGRLNEIGSEIRHSRISTFHDKLMVERETLMRLEHQLHEAEWDVTC